MTQATKIKRKNAVLNHFQHFPKGHALAVGLLACSLGVAALFPSTRASATLQVKKLEIPHLSDVSEEQASLLPDFTEAPSAQLSVPSRNKRVETVNSGDTLSGIFKRAGLSDQQMMELLHATPDAKKLVKLYPGHSLTFSLDEENVLQTLEYTIDKLNSYSFTRSADGFVYAENTRTPDVKYAFRSATIENSLFEAGKAANLDDKLVMELAGIFGWDIDFVLDIRKGDSFKVLYEESFLDGEKIANGNILAAEFINKSERYRAVRYIHENGDAQYYTPSGDTMRKEFLRTPIDFARVSSHFNLNRKHPILNKIRAHKGTDYAAAHGTPIKAAGDGKVTYAGRKGGYGNVVIIQHGQTYKTLYAHISKFRKGIRVGARVKQGQIIAYVGSTGLATGPHLHYEFYVNGAVRNPVRVPLPKAQSIQTDEMQRFLQHTQPLLAELDTETAFPTRLAANDAGTLIEKL